MPLSIFFSLPMRWETPRFTQHFNGKNPSVGNASGQTVLPNPLRMGSTVGFFYTDKNF
ncbi:hypothetical protein [Brevibacillus fluminis]|uniref:hypothetical protein n=1 Tax=Brevibacillus fluminis TaxID=511487 RepID=UPI0016067FE1|nr:hypothetical protein [Brevibacillus fluminis]